MVLMSSRMCLVEVLGGLWMGEDRVRSAKSQTAPAGPGQGRCYCAPGECKRFLRILVLTLQSRWEVPSVPAPHVRALGLCGGRDLPKPCVSKWQPLHPCRLDLGDCKT